MQISSVPLSGTDITSEWIRHVLGPVESCSVTEIGVDFGFGGTAFLLAGIDVAGAKRTVVAKLATADRTRREIDFYEQCAPATPVRTPGFIGGDTTDDRGVIVLEYLAGLEQGNVLTGCSESQFMALASTLGRLHGRWWRARQSDLDSLRIPPPTPRLIEGRMEVALARHPISDLLASVLVALPDRLGSAHGALYDGPTTLTHRDFHLDNVLFDGCSQPVILDWQSAAVGPPAMDVARLFVDCRPPHLASALVDQALRTYLDTLNGNIGITMAELRSQIRRSFDCQLAATINWLGRDEIGKPGSRMAALEEAVLEMLGDAIGYFNSD